MRCLQEKQLLYTVKSKKYLLDYLLMNLMDIFYKKITLTILHYISI